MDIANEMPSFGNEMAMDDYDDEPTYLGPSTRCVLFTLEDEVYGIQVKKIREVLRVGTIRKVSGATHGVLGVINVRGVIVTVVDSRVMFSMPTREIDDLSRIIIVELDEERTVGILVDFVKEVQDIPDDKIEPLSASKENASRYIQGIAHLQDSVIILIDVDNMFMGVE